MNKQLLLPPGKPVVIEKTVVKEPQSVKEDQNAPIAQSESKKSIFVSALEILTSPTLENNFLVEKIISGATVNMLTGPSDTGKSIFARQLAVSIALGKEEVFGLKLAVKYKKAIVVSTEDGAGDWKKKLGLYHLTQEEKSLLNNLFLVLDDGFNTTELEDKLKQEPVDLVVIDVFTDLFGKDLNNVISVREFFKPYKTLAKEYGCTFLFLHHLSKKGEASSPSKMNVLGSQGIESSMRSLLELRPDPNDEDARHLIITKANYLESSEKKDSFKLILNKSTLEFEYTGERAPIGSLGSSKSMRVGSDPEIINKVVQLSGKLSFRDISKELEKDGIRLGKTTIGEIIKKAKPNHNLIEEKG